MIIKSKSFFPTGFTMPIETSTTQVVVTPKVEEGPVKVYGTVAAAAILGSLLVVIIFVYICNRMMLETKGIEEGREASIGTTLTEMSTLSHSLSESDTDLDSEDNFYSSRFKSKGKLASKFQFKKMLSRPKMSSTMKVDEILSDLKHVSQPDDQSIESIEYIPSVIRNEKSKEGLVEKQPYEQDIDNITNNPRNKPKKKKLKGKNDKKKKIQEPPHSPMFPKTPQLPKSSQAIERPPSPGSPEPLEAGHMENRTAKSNRTKRKPSKSRRTTPKIK